MKLRIGFTQETEKRRKRQEKYVVHHLLVYINLLALLYVLSTRVDYVLCGNGFYSLSNVESNKSKCCPALPGAWVPANAGTHAEPLYVRYDVSKGLPVYQYSHITQHQHAYLRVSSGFFSNQPILPFNFARISSNISSKGKPLV